MHYESENVVGTRTELSSCLLYLYSHMGMQAMLIIWVTPPAAQFLVMSRVPPLHQVNQPLDIETTLPNRISRHSQ